MKTVSTLQWWFVSFHLLIPTKFPSPLVKLLQAQQLVEVGMALHHYGSLWAFPMSEDRAGMTVFKQNGKHLQKEGPKHCKGENPKNTHNLI